MTFEILEKFNEFLWGYVAFLLIVGLGLYFSIKSKFFQLRKLPQIFKIFWNVFKEKQQGRGLHPIKVFFAAIGGCIGIGNIVGIVTAVQIGGPGALFWTWIGGIFGMLIQYSEVFLGIKTRITNSEGSFDGGPMYFLPLAYKTRWIAPIICLLLSLYGVEIFMFNVMAESISTNWNINEYIVVGLLTSLVLIVASGGINRVGEVCSAIIPLFIIVYVGMAIWVIYQNHHLIPEVFSLIFKGAFSKQAAIGGFAGSTLMTTISMGLSRGAYSGDIGVGYTSVIYAESRTKKVSNLASLTIIGIIIDTFMICTLSLLIVLLTGLWNSPIDASLLVQTSLSKYFPFMDVFMPIFLFLLGYSTILAYFVVGAKCAKYISKKWGPILYYLYASIALPLFAFIDAKEAFVIMSISGAFLLILNLTGMFMLRKQIQFELE